MGRGGVPALWPEAERLYTWNSASNGPMLRVNEELGYVPAALSLAWQRRLCPEPGEA